MGNGKILELMKIAGLFGGKAFDDTVEGFVDIEKTDEVGTFIMSIYTVENDNLCYRESSIMRLLGGNALYSNRVLKESEIKNNLLPKIEKSKVIKCSAKVAEWLLDRYPNIFDGKDFDTLD